MANLQTLLGDFTFENLPPAWTAGDFPSPSAAQGKLGDGRGGDGAAGAPLRAGCAATPAVRRLVRALPATGAGISEGAGSAGRVRVSEIQRV